MSTQGMQQPQTTKSNFLTRIPAVQAFMQAKAKFDAARAEANERYQRNSEQAASWRIKGVTWAMQLEIGFEHGEKDGKLRREQVCTTHFGGMSLAALESAHAAGKLPRPDRRIYAAALREARSAADVEARELVRIHLGIEPGNSAYYNPDSPEAERIGLIEAFISTNFTRGALAQMHENYGYGFWRGAGIKGY
jgi:hypothetical protein